MSSNLPAVLAARINALPPILSVRNLADLLDKKVETVRQQIRRKVFPIRVNQIEGGEQYVTLNDLIKFLQDGQPQPQPPLVKRAARNPYGRHGKRGRPTNAERAARGQAEGGAQ